MFRDHGLIFRVPYQIRTKVKQKIIECFVIFNYVTRPPYVNSLITFLPDQ